MSSVTLKNLNKSFGAVKVLHDLNLEIDEGEFVALVGPSGCGKSTLLRIIAGLDNATSGDIWMNEKWVNEYSPRERNIAMVFQSYALYPHMTVAENIGFNLRISGLSKADIKSRVSDAAAILDLDELMERKPSQLSGGQRQRVAMGRALVRDPDAFLFDEPLSNLDAKLRVQMREEIKRLHQKVRTTSIYVTHDQIEAMTLADRIVIMNDGRIQQMGTPTELYKQPANKFVAGFIGSPSMNFLDGKVGTSQGKTHVVLDDGHRLEVVDNGNLPDNGQVVVGIRPEHLQFCTDDNTTNRLEGKVDLIEPTGAQNHLKISVNDQKLTFVDTTLRELSIDDAVSVHIPADKVHVFAQDS